MWNPFKKNSTQVSNATSTDDKTAVIKKKEEEKKDEPQSPKMNMLQRIAMKKLEKMSPAEQQKMMAEAFNPKNRDKMLSVMEAMRKSGQISEEQYNMAKQKLGL